MNAVSMDTRNLKALLRKLAEKNPGYRVCAAQDVIGPGGGVFIAAHTELTRRHLAWLEQRNPARKTTPTYVDVVFSQQHLSASSLTAELELAAEAPEAKEERQQRANEISRQVITRGEDVAREAQAIFQVIGDTPFTVANLHSPEVAEHLESLGWHVQLFHRIVAVALDEYLDGNTLIMDLIAEYQGPHIVRHGLNVAVFAVEMCSYFLKGHDGLEEYFGADVPAQDPAAQSPGVASVQERYLRLFKKELAEIFLGGFMHDCGLWNDALSLQEGHEKMGAKLVWSAPELCIFAPYLTKVLLFHSDIIRLADRAGLVQIIERPDDPEHTAFNGEFYKTGEEAQKALKTRRGEVRAEVLRPADLRRILPVALAEYYITQSEGFEAKSRPEVVGALVRHARDGRYPQYMLALCNAQMEMIAPRRAYVKLEGCISTLVKGKDQSRKVQQLDLKGFEGISISHSNDMYSPHLIVLYEVDGDGNRRELEYVAPQDGDLWGHGVNPVRRMYLPAGRYKSGLSIEVTGFMNEEVYDKVLGAYERELKRQMMS